MKSEGLADLQDVLSAFNAVLDSNCYTSTATSSSASSSSSSSSKFSSRRSHDRDGDGHGGVFSDFDSILNSNSLHPMKASVSRDERDEEVHHHDDDDDIDMATMDGNTDETGEVGEDLLPSPADQTQDAAGAELPTTDRIMENLEVENEKADQEAEECKQLLAQLWGKLQEQHGDTAAGDGRSGGEENLTGNPSSADLSTMQELYDKIMASLSRSLDGKETVIRKLQQSTTDSISSSSSSSSAQDQTALKQQLLHWKRRAGNLDSQLSNLESEHRDVMEKTASAASRDTQKINDLQQDKIELLAQVKDLQQELETYRPAFHELPELQAQHDAVQAELQDLQGRFQELQADFQKTCAELEEKQEELAQTHESYKMQLEAWTSKVHTLNADLVKLKLEQQAMSLELSIHKQHQKDDPVKLDALTKLSQARIEEERSKSESLRPELEQTGAELQRAQAQIQKLTADLHENETLRRKLHNTIQDLRGSVRVVARVRPFLGQDDNPNLGPSVEVREDRNQICLLKKGGGGGGGGGGAENGSVFSFDRVFGMQSTQEQVFEEVSQLVQSALDGYNVCLFSYGQTGSGKSWTMQGDGRGKDRGIIPRAVQQVLATSHRLQRQGWEYELHASYLEIYNEEIRDLLSRDTKAKRDKLDGFTQVRIQSFADVERVVSTANAARSVAKTAMNSVSSRSHSIFTLRLTGQNRKEKSEVRGSLNLCDLAGNERIKASKVEGERLRETQNINKSLSALGKVFRALRDKASHIPFRDSKLTMLLRDCLQGDGKALMFVNLSPTMKSLHETECSLKFSADVRQVKLGKGKANRRSIAAAPPAAGGDLSFSSSSSASRRRRSSTSGASRRR